MTQSIQFRCSAQQIVQKNFIICIFRRHGALSKLALLLYEQLSNIRFIPVLLDYWEFYLKQ